MTDTPDLEPVASTDPISRSFALDDLVVRSEGDGRTVEAYAAVFGAPTEISDHFGHYLEVIDRAAFNGAIKRGSKVSVLFNHGRDIYGNPSDRFSMPIGTPESITTDARGLRTVTRIARTELGDEVLELMRDGAIDGFSFTGRPIKSEKISRSKQDGLPTIVRTELSLREYGPAVFRAYEDARVLALRSVDELATQVGQLTPDQLAELVDVLRSRVPDLAEGRSDDTRDADDTAPPTWAGSEFNHQRRLLAARLRGLTPQ